MNRPRVQHLGQGMGLRAWFGQTQSMARAHTHDDIEFNYVLDGAMSYLIGGQVCTIGPGQLGVIWGAMPHQTLPSSKGTKLAWSTLPLSNTLLTSLPRPFVQQFLRQGIALAPRNDEGDLLLLRRWERDLKQPTSARRDLVIREMELRLHRLALDVSAASGRSRKSAPVEEQVKPDHGYERVVRMAAYIAEHYEQPITADDVAAAVNLHPNYAMTLFRRHTHTTLNAYLTRQRIAHAQRLLATTDEPVLEIGLDSGFGSPSRFFEAFQKIAGCSPRVYRQRLAQR